MRTRSLVWLSLILTSLPLLAQDLKESPNVLLRQADVAYHAKRYGESAKLYSQTLVLASDVVRADAEYSLACAQALAGDHVAAITALQHAVEDGYLDRKVVESDAALTSLHSDQAWPKLLEHMSQLKAERDARWGDAAFDTPYVENISDAEKLAGLSELWTQAKYGFGNFWHVPQLNWDQSYREFIPQVLATHSTDEYYRVLTRFYALLQDGHSKVYAPGMLNGKYGRLPLRTRLIEGHLLVIGAGDPELDGIRPGDEIVSINGEPALHWAERNIAPYVSASTPQDRDVRTYDYGLFLAPIGTQFALVTQKHSGTQNKHFFTVAGDTPHRQLEFELKLLPGNIAYVALNGFGDETAAKEWDSHWAEIAKASALILDLRENGGGNDSFGFHILAALVDKPTPELLCLSTRWIATPYASNMGEVPLRYPLEFIDPDPERHYSGPVAMLISPRTFSAAEDTAIAFVQSHRGKVLGEPTGGSTGMPLSFKLPGGGKAHVCTEHDSFADGREFIGVGVLPDIPVAVTRDDIIAGRDPVLETAIHLLHAGN